MEKLKRILTAENLMSVQRKYRGSNYSEVTHAEVITKVKEAIKNKGLTLETESYLGASNGQRMVGMYGLAYPNKDMRFMIAIVNSMDGSMAFKAISASQIRACSNGMITTTGGLDHYKRKHSGVGHDEIMAQIEPVIGNIEAKMKYDIEIMELFKEIEVSKRVRSELTGRLFLEEELIRSEQLSILKREMNTPTHIYGRENSLWQFYNDVTFSLKSASPLEYIKQHKGVSDFFVDEFGIKVGNNSSPEDVEFVETLQPEIVEEEHPTDIF